MREFIFINQKEMSKLYATESIFGKYQRQLPERGKDATCQEKAEAINTQKWEIVGMFVIGKENIN